MRKLQLPKINGAIYIGNLHWYRNFKIVLLFIFCAIVIPTSAQEFHGSLNVGSGKGNFSITPDDATNLNYKAEYGFYYKTNLAIIFPVNFGIGINFSQINARYKFESDYPDLNKGYRYYFNSKQYSTGINILYRQNLIPNLKISPYIGINIGKYVNGTHEFIWKSESVLNLPPENIFKINISDNFLLGYTAGFGADYQFKNGHSFGAGVEFSESFDPYIIIQYNSPVTNKIATAETKGSNLSYYLTYNFLINPPVEESFGWQNLKNNEVYAEYGGIGGNISLYFEHIIKRTSGRTFGARGGIGIVYNFGIESLEFPFGITNSFGTRNHFFEADLGFRATKPIDPSPMKRRLLWEYSLFTGFGYKLILNDKVIIKVIDYPFLSFERFSSRYRFNNSLGIAMGIKI